MNAQFNKEILQLNIFFITQVYYCFKSYTEIFYNINYMKNSLSRFLLQYLL